MVRSGAGSDAGAATDISRVSCGGIGGFFVSIFDIRISLSALGDFCILICIDLRGDAFGEISWSGFKG